VSRRTVALVALIVALVLSVVLLAGCGGGDPYTGTWTGSSLGALTIEPANPGWWSIKLAGDSKTFYGADVDGMLQTGNGGMTFKASGDKLSATLAPGTSAVELTKQ
jgi:hypothetical protein